jgi:hypothetical protein
MVDMGDDRHVAELHVLSKNRSRAAKARACRGR